MSQKVKRVVEVLIVTVLALIALATAVWAGPPAPPVIAAALPRTPLGGTEISLATAAGIAAYGIWKSRR
jgi:hypothetical protein